MIKGKNDVTTIKTRVHTSDDRGGVTTAYVTKIESLVCSFQPVRREELRMDLEGQEVVEPYMMLYDNITTGEDIVAGDIVVFESRNYLVVVVQRLSGKGAHTEAVLKHVSSDGLVS